MPTNQESRPPGAGLLSRRGLERAAAVLLILYVLAVAVSVSQRVSSNADAAISMMEQGSGAADPASLTPADTPTTPALKARNYTASQAASLIAAVILVALAAVSYRVFRGYDRTLALLGAFMFLGAAFLSCFAGVVGLTLAQEYSLLVPAQAAPGAVEYGSIQALEPLRALAGKTSFTFAGLGLLAFGGLIAWSGALPRWIGGLGIVAGAIMFYIWIDAIPILHRIGGGAYLLWLALLAGWLMFRGTGGVADAADNADNTENGER